MKAEIFTKQLLFNCGWKIPTFLSIPPHQKEFCPSGELAIIWHTYVQQVLSSLLFLEIYDYPMQLLRLCLEVYQRYVGGDVGDVRG